MPLHLRKKKKKKKKKLKEQKIAAKNSEALVLDFEFDPEEILDKSLIFNLKKTS